MRPNHMTNQEGITKGKDPMGFVIMNMLIMWVRIQCDPPTGANRKKCERNKGPMRKSVTMASY